MGPTVSFFVYLLLFVRCGDYYNRSVSSLSLCSKSKQKNTTYFTGDVTGSRRTWTGRYQNIPLKFYGGGCDQDFDVYLQGESQVPVKSIDEIANWLLGCKYIDDPTYKGLRDHWQHPLEFEKTRAGDCEDFALWAWRKLISLNVQCEFMVGKRVRNGCARTHAWVLFYDNDKIVIFETTGKTKDRMFKPLESVAAEYIPFAAIDNNVKKKVYVGIAKWLIMLANRK